METSDIVRALSKDAYTRWLVCDVFDGVHAADQLHSPLKHPTSMVVNTDPSWKQGRHWVAIYLPNSGSLEYFDSFGEPQRFLSYDDSWKINRLFTIANPFRVLPQTYVVTIVSTTWFIGREGWTWTASRLGLAKTGNVTTRTCSYSYFNIKVNTMIIRRSFNTD